MGESMVSAELAAWLAEPGRGVAITGAAGWIGRAMVHGALAAGCTNLRLFGSRARSLEVAGRTLPLETLREAAPLGDGQWLVLHLAVAGADRFAEPLARRAANEAMLADALALAGTGQVRRFVCASSGAVYAPFQADPDKQAYNDLKRDQEQIARAWAARTGVPLLMPRIFNVGGPYMNHAERYALGSLILQARRAGRVRIQAKRPVLRSYVDVLELARVVFALALDDASSLTFDTAGDEVVEMAGLAEAVGRALALPDLIVERPPLDGAEEDRYVGDGATYHAILGAPPVGLDAIIRDTDAWLAGF